MKMRRTELLDVDKDLEQLSYKEFLNKYKVRACECCNKLNADGCTDEECRFYKDYIIFRQEIKE